MPKATVPDAKFKIRCIEAVLAGATVTNVAKQNGVARETVRDWVTGAGHDFAILRRKKIENAVDLLADYLERSITAMHEQIQILSDKAWLKKADPARITAIATAHGITCDKAFRILEAAESARERNAGSGQRLLPIPAADATPEIVS